MEELVFPPSMLTVFKQRCGTNDFEHEQQKPPLCMLTAESISAE